jgi:hypothetical protein
VENLPEAIVSDGRLLEKKFDAADGVIDAGELDHREFSSELVRKVIYLQREFSSKEACARYDEEKVDGFRALARHFLTELKDGSLTSESTREVSRHLKNNFPKLQMPKKR